MANLSEKIEHIVVLMLENRSFDSMLGKLYPKSSAFDGLSGDESNFFNLTKIPVWNGQGSLESMTIPNPDPGESFADINEQLFGNSDALSQGAIPTMSGFASNYVR